MFRYLAIAWDDALPDRSESARQIILEWQARSSWDAALLRPGLQVFTTGTRAGINEVRSLQGDLHEDLGVVLGKLFRRGEFNSLPSPSATLNSKDMTNILASGGRALVSDFWGRYVAFLHTAAGSTLVLRDPSGALPCFRIRHQGLSIIFSWLEDALQMLAHVEPRSVNWSVLTAQILYGTQGGRETALDGVTQLLPGELLDLHAETSALLWNAVEIARSPAAYSFEEATQLLRQTARSCIRAWASCYDTLLLRLSGGVDSSILLSCLAADSTPADVICVNYHSPGSNSDERLYARLAALRVGRDLLERERDPSFYIARVLLIARMPDPVPYVGWMNTSTDANLATFSLYMRP
ncbi:MAG: hypothetical protein IV107_24445, partial [Paucibacter sp.]|nr:hypothetical protein [Roseateles sp.]